LPYSKNANVLFSRCAEVGGLDLYINLLKKEVKDVHLRDKFGGAYVMDPLQREEIYKRILPDLALYDFENWMTGEKSIGAFMRPLSCSQWLQENASGLRNPGRRTPINEVLVVPSDGCKFRVVSKSHPGLHVKGNVLFQRMMKFLSKQSCLEEVLKGNYAKACL